MISQSTDEQTVESFNTTSRRSFLTMMTLLSLIVFVFGGCITLLIVNSLLNSQLDAYVSTQSMAAASTILDFMEDLLLFYFLYGGILLILVLATASVVTWMKTQSSYIRYGVLLLCLIIVLILGGMRSFGSSEVQVSPTTPTPVSFVVEIAV